MLWGGVFEPVEPPVEKPETPTTPPSTKDLITIKIEDDIMAVVGTNTTSWMAISYGNGKYVAVGSGGYTTTSTDGKTWSTPKQAGTEEWRAIAYGNGKYVAVGRKNVAVSTDGTTWSVYNNVSPSYLLSVAYGSGKFVMVGSNSYIGVSTDGEIWTNIAEVDAGYLYDIIYADGKFRAIGQEGYYATSIDGTIWAVNKIEQSSRNTWSCIAYKNGQVVVAGTNGICCFTDVDVQADVVQVLYPGYNYLYWQDIIYDKGMFIAIGATYISNNRGIGCISVSSDGKTWSSPIRIQDENGNDIQYYFNGLVIMFE